MMKNVLSIASVVAFGFAGVYALDKTGSKEVS